MKRSLELLQTFRLTEQIRAFGLERNLELAQTFRLTAAHSQDYANYV